MAEYNPGFAFYREYYEAIENLPLEQQKEICYAMVKYGITNEMVDSKEMPLGRTLTMANKMSIDNSVIRWEKNIAKANMKIDESISKDNIIVELILEGLNSIQIAAKMNEMGIEIGDSAIRKSDPWIHRKDADFKEKWCVKKCENSQNFCEEEHGNVNVNDCENSQNVTENVNEERDDSQNLINRLGF